MQDQSAVPRKTQIATAASALLLLCAAVPMTAQAESSDNNAKDDGKVQEIVITAQKRVERVIETPVAISVVGEAALANMNATDISDINKMVPSVELKGTFNGRVPYSIRGISTNADESAVGLTSGVSIMIDGVPVPSDSMAANELQDIRRVEVLKGPQSTLGGRTASAGVINFITNSPSETLGGDVVVTGTSDNERRVTAMISGPANQSLGFSISAYDDHREYPIKNLFSNQNSKSDNSGARLKLALAVDKDLDITLALRIADAKSTGETFTYQYLTPGVALFPYFPFAPGGVSQAQSFPGVNIHDGNTDYNSPVDMTSNVRDQDVTLNIEKRVGGYTFTSTTANQSETAHNVQDITAQAVYFLDTLRAGFIPPPPAGPPYFNNTSDIALKPTSFSQEFKISSPVDQTVSYVAGLFYSDVKVTESVRRNMFVNYDLRDVVSDTKSTGLYGRATINLSEQTSLLTGLRYNRDQISYVMNMLNPDLSVDSATSSSNSDTSSIAVGDITLRQKLGKDQMVYGTYSRGYKPRVFNTAATPNDNTPFTPVNREDIDNFEIGLKSALANGQAQISVDAFDTTYKNYQAQIYPSGQIIPSLELTNVPKASTKGLEADLNWVISPGTRLNLSAAYIDAIYNEFNNATAYPGQTPAQGAYITGTLNGAPVFAQNLSGKSMPDAPKFKLSTSLDKNFGAGEVIPWDLALNAQYAYRTSAHLQADNNPQTYQAGFGLLNLSGTVTAPSGKYSITGFVDNVTNHFYLVNAEDFFSALYATPGTMAPANAVIGQPARDAKRYVGVRLHVYF